MPGGSSNSKDRYMTLLPSGPNSGSAQKDNIALFNNKSIMCTKLCWPSKH